MLPGNGTADLGLRTLRPQFSVLESLAPAGLGKLSCDASVKRRVIGPLLVLEPKRGGLQRIQNVAEVDLSELGYRLRSRRLGQSRSDGGGRRVHARRRNPRGSGSGQVHDYSSDVVHAAARVRFTDEGVHDA